jgi:hypothetical protein
MVDIFYRTTTVLCVAMDNWICNKSIVSLIFGDDGVTPPSCSCTCTCDCIYIHVHFSTLYDQPYVHVHCKSTNIQAHHRRESFVPPPPHRSSARRSQWRGFDINLRLILTLPFDFLGKIWHYMFMLKSTVHVHVRRLWLWTKNKAFTH